MSRTHTYRLSRKRPRQGRHRVISCCVWCDVCGRPIKGRSYLNALYSRLCRACFKADAFVAEEGRAV